MTPGLRIEDVRFAYGAKTALDGVSFVVAPAAFCALLGPSGCGKSSVAALLALNARPLPFR